MMPEALLIKGGRVINPAQRTDATADLLIENGKISYLRKSGGEAPGGCRTIDATGFIVSPGFIDLHCHLREPGFEAKETIATGTLAAAKGGYTTICCMPNTDPPLDNRAAVDFIKARSAAVGAVRVLPIGCITKGRKGEGLSEMAELAEAGVVGYSDDGNSVPDSRLMRHALEYSRVFGLPVIEHCEDKRLVNGGVINEGPVAIRLGLRGMPSAAEEIIVSRDLALAELTGAMLHIAHVSTAGSVELIRRAKERGIRVTAEATPHHLTLTEDRVMVPGRHPARHGLDPSPLPADAYDTFAKVNPPLRSERDRQALVQGIRDGTIDAIATDHAPHTWEDKACEFGRAAFGMSLIETAFGVLMGLVQGGQLDLMTLLSKLTAGPAKVLEPGWEGLGILAEGFPADVVLIDTDAEWVVEEKDLLSRGKNNPFIASGLKGKIVATIAGGRIAYQDEALKQLLV